MSLRNQPYLPLYVQDYLTDEKLNMCSFATQGIYIRIMCLMHKSEPYGTIPLTKTDKQKMSKKLSKSELFAIKIAKLMPIQIGELAYAIDELLDEKVLYIKGDMLIQKRMYNDGELSKKRAEAGRQGGMALSKPTSKTETKSESKKEATPENENANENEVENEVENEDKIKERSVEFRKTVFTVEFSKLYGKEMLEEFYQYWSEPNRSNTKMRCELQKTWDVKRRLITWSNRDDKFKKTDERIKFHDSDYENN